MVVEGGNKTKNTWKERVSGTKKRLSTALRTEGEKLCIQSSFYLPGKEKLQMKSALEDDKPFLVELIQTVISTVETRHRQTHRNMDFHSLRP